MTVHACRKATVYLQSMKMVSATQVQRTWKRTSLLRKTSFVGGRELGTATSLIVLCAVPAKDRVVRFISDTFRGFCMRGVLFDDYARWNGALGYAVKKGVLESIQC